MSYMVPGTDAVWEKAHWSNAEMEYYAVSRISEPISIQAILNGAAERGVHSPEDVFIEGDFNDDGREISRHLEVSWKVSSIEGKKN